VAELGRRFCTEVHAFLLMHNHLTLRPGREAHEETFPPRFAMNAHAGPGTVPLVHVEHANVHPLNVHRLLCHFDVQ
jgi:hypothetical protein